MTRERINPAPSHNSNPRPGGTTSSPVTVVADGRTSKRTDRVATEEPLEIRLEAASRSTPVAVTMRTPGHDFELAAGFLFSEGLIKQASHISEIKYCLEGASEQLFNVVTVNCPQPPVDPRSIARNFYTTSSCGVCGKGSLEALEISGAVPVCEGPQISAGMVAALPAALRKSQRLFESTGGLHAAALFDPAGSLLLVREDVGRHNAVDKLIGRRLMDGRLPLDQEILMVSGRTSFEIMQKAVSAGIPVVCAVSAPSSLAVEVARRFNVTLIGFIRDNRFNIYSGESRVVTA